MTRKARLVLIRDLSCAMPTKKEQRNAREKVTEETSGRIGINSEWAYVAFDVFSVVIAHVAVVSHVSEKCVLCR